MQQMRELVLVRSALNATVATPEDTRLLNTLQPAMLEMVQKLEGPEGKKMTAPPEPFVVEATGAMVTPTSALPLLHRCGFLLLAVSFQTVMF